MYYQSESRNGDNSSVGTTSLHMSKATPRATSHAVWRRVGDEVVIINLETNRIFVLNYTAARLWERLESDATMPQIEEELSREFDVTTDVIAKEAEKLIASLSAEGLVHVGARA